MAVVSSSDEPREAGAHGRLSQDYMQQMRGLDSSPTHGWLTRGYADAAAQLARQPGLAFRLMLDERFERGQLPAERTPLETRLRDVVVSGTFRTFGGPPGGSYGLIVRDLGQGPRYRRVSTGRFYVALVNDRGNITIRRHDHEQQVELVPWTPTDAVQPGLARNHLSLEAVGARLTFVVNGAHVATAYDAALDRGSVGVFTSGSDNDISIERFAVHAFN